MEELEYCPFCGGEANIIDGGRDGGVWFINCYDCGVEMSPCEAIPKEQIIKAWNTRVK